jgi:hypothetical protein
MSLDYYSEVFKKLLLRNVIIKCGSKTYRSGKIQNFDIKQFYIKLYIENNKHNLKIIELPYPFIISTTANTTTLNYHISSFTNTNTNTFVKIKTLNNKESSKYFDNIIEIVAVD